MAYPLGHGLLINFVGDRCELQPLTDIVDESGGLVGMLPALRGTGRKYIPYYEMARKTITTPNPIRKIRIHRRKTSIDRRFLILLPIIIPIIAVAVPNTPGPMIEMGKEPRRPRPSVIPPDRHKIHKAKDWISASLVMSSPVVCVLMISLLFKVLTFFENSIDWR